MSNNIPPSFPTAADLATQPWRRGRGTNNRGRWRHRGSDAYTPSSAPAQAPTQPATANPSEPNSHRGGTFPRRGGRGYRNARAGRPFNQQPTLPANTDTAVSPSTPSIQVTQAATDSQVQTANPSLESTRGAYRGRGRRPGYRHSRGNQQLTSPAGRDALESTQTQTEMDKISARIAARELGIRSNALGLALKRAPQKFTEFKQTGTTISRFGSPPPMDSDLLPQYIRSLEAHNRNNAKEIANQEVAAELVKENERSERHGASSVISTTLQPSQATSAPPAASNSGPQKATSSTATDRMKADKSQQSPFSVSGDLPHYWTPIQRARLTRAEKMIDGSETALQGMADRIRVYGESASGLLKLGKKLSSETINVLAGYSNIRGLAHDAEETMTVEHLEKFRSDPRNKALFTALEKLGHKV